MKRELIIIVLIAGAGCAQPSAEQDAAQPALRALGQSIAPEEESRSDEAIGSEIRERLNSTGPGELSGVLIEIEDGVVTLRGDAPSVAAAWRAEARARSVKGVKQVVNRIAVVQ